MGMALVVLIIAFSVLLTLEMGAWKLKLRRHLQYLRTLDVLTEDELYQALYCNYEINSLRIRPYLKLSLSEQGFLVDKMGKLATYSIVHRYIKRRYGTTNIEELSKIWITLKNNSHEQHQSGIVSDTIATRTSLGRG